MKIQLKKLITFVQGINVGSYSSVSGGTFRMVDGLSVLEVDKLTVRLSAIFTEIIISKLRHVKGGLVLSKASLTVQSTSVPEAGITAISFDNDNGAVSNDFVVGDLVRCQVFTGTSLKFWAGEVDFVGAGFIEVSDYENNTGSLAIGDEVIQLGHISDSERQFAQILTSEGIIQYANIDNYSLEGKEVNKIIGDGSGNELYGKVTFLSSDGEESFTSINGGFLSTAKIFLRDLGSKIITAGVSGIQSDGFLPSYWSGGHTKMQLILVYFTRH